MSNDRKVTVLVDSREQKPLLFPKIMVAGGRGRQIVTETVKLGAGDYMLKSYLHDGPCVIVERKASISEIFNNMLDPKDSRRQKRAFDKLVTACDYPILIIEGSVGSLSRVTKYAPDPALALDALLRETMVRGIHLWFVGECGMPAKRRMVGELIVRAMLAWQERL